MPKEEVKSLLEQLPDELLQDYLAPYLSDAELRSLSYVSKSMFFKCCGLFEKRIYKALLSHVIKGEETEALTMIHNNPHLLLHPSEATDYSRRIYKCLPFQAALLCHDVTLWKKIEPYFDELPNGQVEKIRQFKQIFPKGLPKQNPYKFNSLIEAISNSSESDIRAVFKKEDNDTLICKALKNFRKIFKDLAKAETFFNPLHLIEAFKVHDEQFESWSRSQRELFWQQVVGYVQRFLPACYAQAFCQGILSIVEESQPLSRSLRFKHTPLSYYPLTDSSGLGFDFAIYGPWVRLDDCVGPDADLITKLIGFINQVKTYYLDLNIACVDMVDMNDPTSSPKLPLS